MGHLSAETWLKIKEYLAASVTVSSGAAGGSGFIEDNYQALMFTIALIGLLSQIYFSWSRKKFSEKVHRETVGKKDESD